MKNIIITKRLYLRNFLAEDITQVYLDALNDESVIGLTESRHVEWNREKAIRYIRESSASNRSELIGIFLTKADKHIGNIRLHSFDLNHKRVELGILIHDKAEWAKGYGTEALEGVIHYVFGELGFYKICAEYYSVNKGSAKIFKKAGCVIEGIFKNHFILDNKFVDAVRVAKFNDKVSF